MVLAIARPCGTNELKVLSRITDYIVKSFRFPREEMPSLIKDDSHMIKRLSADKILTTREIAAMLKLEEAAICKMAASGELPGIKIGKFWRFVQSEVLRRIGVIKSHPK